MASYDEVIEEAFGVLRTAWNAGSVAIVGGSTIPPILLEDTDQTGAAPGTAPTVSDPTGGTRVIASNEAFARYSFKHKTGQNAAVGKKLFRRDAVLMCQFFYPRRGGVGKAKAAALARLAQSAYESAGTSHVNFVRVSLREVGPSGPWYQVNVSADAYWFERK